MTGGQRRPSFDVAIEDSAFLKHELEVIDPLQLPYSQRQRQKQQHHRQQQEGSANNEYSGDSDNDDNDNDNFWMESRLFLELAGVTSLMSIGFVMSPLLTASYVGRNFPSVYLSAFTLANLTGNLCTFALMTGLLSASDTLSPQAFGRGDFPEVGRIAIRGFATAFALLFPVNVILFFHLDTILIALGQDTEASTYASQWYRVFAFSLPFSVLFNCLWKFLTAQHIMKPLILVSVLCPGLVLPMSLKICAKTMGFVGSAVAYVIFQASQAILLLLYVWWKQPHNALTWPGLSSEIIRSALEWNQMKGFLHLGMGGILAQCEWFFWEAVGLVVGKLGVVALSVHTIPNQTTMAVCMVPFSFGVAVAIRMGISLPVSVRRTQAIVLATSGFSFILFGLVSGAVYVYRDAIIALFTTDDAVKKLAKVIWWKVSLFNLNVAVFAILAGIATGLGKQWPLGVINFVYLWLFGLPMIYYTAIVLDQGLNAAWLWMNIPYLCMNMTLVFLFVFTDWHRVRERIILAGEKKDGDDNDDGHCGSEESEDANQQGEIVVANEKTTLLKNII